MLMVWSSRRTPKSEPFRLLFSFPGSSLEIIPCSVEPSIPYVPNYKGDPGLISPDFYTRMEVPRGHSNGYMILPWGEQITLQAIGNLKHTWSNKIMANTISAYVRGSTYLPNIPPLPIATVTWYQAWDVYGNGAFIFRLWGDCS